MLPLQTFNELLSFSKATHRIRMTAYIQCTKDNQIGDWIQLQHSTEVWPSHFVAENPTSSSLQIPGTKNASNNTLATSTRQICCLLMIPWISCGCLCLMVGSALCIRTEGGGFKLREHNGLGWGCPSQLIKRTRTKWPKRCHKYRSTPPPANAKLYLALAAVFVPVALTALYFSISTFHKLSTAFSLFKFCYKKDYRYNHNWELFFKKKLKVMLLYLNRGTGQLKLAVHS